MNWAFLGILAAASMVFCAMGFYEFVWFMSVGYGFAVSAIGVAMGIMGLTGAFGIELNVVMFLQCVMFLIYGIRLGGFLFVREIKNSAYKKTLDAAGGTKAVPIFVKIPMWIFLTVLYVCQTAGVTFRAMNRATDSLVMPIIGLVIMICGVLLEATADKQKSAQKKEDPHMVATKGLFKIVRCPNYFGEICFWTGTFVSGIGAYQGVAQWIIAIVAYIAIVYIMFNGAQRLEKRQSARLAGDPRYEEYANKTPIIIPFLPIYHLYDPAKDAAKEAKKSK